MIGTKIVRVQWPSGRTAEYREVTEYGLGTATGSVKFKGRKVQADGTLGPVKTYEISGFEEISLEDTPPEGTGK